MAWWNPIKSAEETVNKARDIVDAITGESATNGGGDVEFEVPDDFNRMYRKVTTEAALGFGPKNETKEERWAREREIIADVRASRERNNKER